MTDRSDQQWARRRRELAKRYGQQQEKGGVKQYAVPDADIISVVEKAREHQVGGHPSADLTALLSTISPDRQVPRPLGKGVASLIVWLQSLEENSDHNNGS